MSYLWLTSGYMHTHKLDLFPTATLGLQSEGFEGSFISWYFMQERRPRSERLDVPCLHPRCRVIALYPVRFKAILSLKSLDVGD